MLPAWSLMVWAAAAARCSAELTELSPLDLWLDSEEVISPSTFPADSELRYVRASDLGALPLLLGDGTVACFPLEQLASSANG